MKRIFMFILAIFSVVATMAAGIVSQSQSEKQLFMDFGSSQGTVELYIDSHRIQKSGDEIFTALVETAKAHRANLIKSDIVTVGKQTVIEKSVLIHTPSDLFQLRLANGEIAKITALGNNDVYTTEASMDADDTIVIKGIPYSIFNSNHFTIQSLFRKFDTTGSLDGKYEVEISENQDGFFADLAQKLNIPQEQLENSSSVLLTFNNNFVVFACSGFAMICCLIFAVVMVFYITEKFFVIGNCKLLGFSNSKIWRVFFFPIILVQTITVLTGIAVIKIFTNIRLAALLEIVGYALLSIVLTLLITLFSLVMIRRYTISNLLKKNAPVKAIVSFSSLAKLVVLTAVVSILLTGTNYFVTLVDRYNIYENWDKYGDQYAVMNQMMSPEDISDLSQSNNKLERKYIDFYDSVYTKGALYTSAREIDSDLFAKIPDFDAAKLSEPLRSQMLTVNTNYLESFPVVLADGSNAHVEETETRTVYLLPDSMKSQESDYKYLFQYDREKYVTGRETGHPTVEIEFLYYRSGQEFFSFDTMSGRENNYVLRDPIFLVLTPGNMTYYDKADCYANAGTPDCTLKLPTKGMSDGDVYNEYRSIIADCGLENNITQITSIKSTFEGEIAAIQSWAWINFVVAFAFILLSLWVSALITRIKIAGRKRELCIQSLLGFSYFDKYKSMYVELVVMWLLQCGIGWAQYRSSHPNDVLPALLVVGIFIFLLAVDAAFLTLATKRNEKNSVNTAIKGA